MSISQAITQNRLHQVSANCVWTPLRSTEIVTYSCKQLEKTVGTESYSRYWASINGSTQNFCFAASNHLVPETQTSLYRTIECFPIYVATVDYQDGDITNAN